ncbi:unnamed protein product [Medioppia subpectinata]|uniref:C2H2-type domain-containing protein n=1 Tax=Medioppia subpectinata TaxID=1979941 RepID=A0A7R9KCM5_9ACAR|nr:unnamed protein product [Medioppia subpectinata]CAG2100655.1 unnamed protein product [Medioppia subpectinata]
MSSNPLSVLVSIKTLCPEVADYWRSIPSHMKTIVDLKGYVLRDNFIDTDMDDVEFYLYDILLRGNEFIGDVLQNGDYVELRVKIATKKRISSSSEGICDRYKRTKSSFIECITVDDSNDESMSGRSCGQKVVETESISGNQLNALTEDIVNVVKNPIFDPIISQLRDIIGDNTGAVGPQWSSGSDLYLSDDLLRGNSSIGDVMRDRDRIEVRFKFADNTIGHKKPVKSKSNGSVDYRLNSRASISLATAVVTQSGDKCHTKTKAMKTITPEVRPLWPSGSGQTADKWLHTCTEPHCDYKTDSMFELNRHNLVHRMSCDLCFGRTYKTKRTLDMRYRRSHPIDPIADSVVMADNSIINESSDKVISKSESSASDVCPPNSTASISSATEVVTQWTDVWPARTLCPEVDDYWLPIPAAVKTIDGLKRHILSNECIDKDMDGVELFMSDGLLRGNSLVGDVIRDKDRIEMRFKCVDKRRFSSSADSTVSRKRTNTSTNECITVDDSDDESMSGRSGVQTIVKIESISGNQLSDPIVSQSQAYSDRMPSIDSSISLPKVVSKSVAKSGANTKSAEKSVINGSEDMASEAAVIRSESRVSVDFAARISSATAVVTQSGDKWHTSEPIPVSEPMAGSYDTSGESRIQSVANRRRRGHRFPCGYCRIKCFTEDKLHRHHLNSHPYLFPDMPWIKCSRKRCWFQIKDPETMRHHMNGHKRQ